MEAEVPNTQIERMVTQLITIVGKLRVELGEHCAALNNQMNELRTEMQAKGAELRTEMQAMGAELRTEMQAMGDELLIEIHSHIAHEENINHELSVIKSDMHDIWRQVLYQQGEFANRLLLLEDRFASLHCISEKRCS